jgi:hypothetical protein
MEVDRLNRDLAKMNRYHDGATSEAPYRLHDRGTDSGHGLGGPPLSQPFIAYIGQLCTCGRKRDEDDPNDHGCSPAGAVFFRPSDRKSHPRRLKRALRKLRSIAPAEYDAVFLMTLRDFTWHEARERINAGRVLHRQHPYSEAEFVILTVAGTSKLVELF